MYSSGTGGDGVPVCFMEYRRYCKSRGNLHIFIYCTSTRRPHLESCVFVKMITGKSTIQEVWNRGGGRGWDPHSISVIVEHSTTKQEMRLRILKLTLRLSLLLGIPPLPLNYPRWTRQLLRGSALLSRPSTLKLISLSFGSGASLRLTFYTCPPLPPSHVHLI